MCNILPSECSTFAIFEPFLCWLISSDIELPCNTWHAAKILNIIDIDIQKIISRCSILCLLWKFPSHGHAAKVPSMKRGARQGGVAAQRAGWFLQIPIFVFRYFPSQCASLILYSSSRHDREYVSLGDPMIARIHLDLHHIPPYHHGLIHRSQKPSQVKRDRNQRYNSQ